MSGRPGAVVLVFGVLLLLSGCAGARREDAGEIAPAEAVTPDGGAADAAIGLLRIAEQHGTAYAPLALMQIENRIEAEWFRMANATVIREAMLAGRLDIGSMGIPPYLIGRDRGLEWEVIAGVSEVPVGLVTRRRHLTAFADLTGAERIAVPQPGSIQHILLALAADRVWGDPTMFDARLLALSHPDGMAALLAGREIDAHFTTPPFLYEELAAADARLLLDGREAFGGRFTFIISVASPSLVEDNAAAIDHYRQVLAEATAELTALQDRIRQGERPPVLDRLAAHYDIDREDLADQLAQPEVVYSTEIYGLERFKRAMRDFGYVE